MYKGTLDRSTVCIKRIRVTVQDVQERVKVHFSLDHPNVLPLLGITTDPFQLVSKWVSGGNMQECIEKHPDADRRRLVGVPFVVTVRRIILSPAVRRR